MHDVHILDVDLFAQPVPGVGVADIGALGIGRGYAGATDVSRAAAEAIHQNFARHVPQLVSYNILRPRVGVLSDRFRFVCN